MEAFSGPWIRSQKKSTRLDAAPGWRLRAQPPDHEQVLNAAPDRDQMRHSRREGKKRRRGVSGVFSGAKAGAHSALVLVFGAALPRFQARIGFANDIDTATAAHDLAIAAAFFGLLERREHLHGEIPSRFMTRRRL